MTITKNQSSKHCETMTLVSIMWPTQSVGTLGRDLGKLIEVEWRNAKQQWVCESIRIFQICKEKGETVKRNISQDWSKKEKQEESGYPWSA